MLRASMLGGCFAGALAAQAAAPDVAAPQSQSAANATARATAAPTLHVAFADDSAGDGPPALGSLRRDLLAQRPEWPTSRAPSAAFTLHLDERGLRIGEGLALPAYQTPGAAGMDLLAALDHDLVLEPMGRASVPTGVAVAIPDGYEGQVRARSGRALREGLADAARIEEEAAALGAAAEDAFLAGAQAKQ